MANIVMLPQIGISEESAVLTKWYVQKGDTVKAGDILFSLETGKSSFDVESEYSGCVLVLLVDEGDEIAVKSPVCVIGQLGEEFVVDIAQQKTESKKATATGEVKAATAQPQMAGEQLADTRVSGVSPRAKRLATKNDIDPKLAVPSGPGNRVIEKDVRALLDGGAATLCLQAGESAVVQPAALAEYEDKPLSTIRRTIAKNMMESLQNSAQVTHTSSFDASDILNYRKLLKQNANLAGITLGDMVLFAVSRTLPGFPELNAWFLGDRMRFFGGVNLACAVDTEKGLMVPVIFGASKKSLLEISSEMKVLAESCRNGGISPKLLSGGSFTVSNLGHLGIESFTPILNPPQTGILGVNTIITRVREVGGELCAYPCMALSLTYDHRALDGAPASRFLQTLCKNLESFTTVLAK